MFVRSRNLVQSAAQRRAHTPVVFQRSHWAPPAATKPRATETPTPATPVSETAGFITNVPLQTHTPHRHAPAPPPPRPQTDAEAAAAAAELLKAVGAGTSAVSTADLLASMGLGPGAGAGAGQAVVGDDREGRAAMLRQFHESFGSAPLKPASVKTEPARPALPVLPPGATDEELLLLQQYLAGDLDVPADDAQRGAEWEATVHDDLARALDKEMLRAHAAGAQEHQQSSSAPRSNTTTRPAAVSTDVAPVTVKERKFYDALHDTRKALDAAGVPFFITCGTALGARREGRFIAHDEDIDVGIFWGDLAGTIRSNTARAAAADEGTDEGEVETAQQRVLDLLSTIGTDSRMICFDVLGEVNRGFQLRLRHLDSGVLVDVNVYYRAKDSDGNDYVWCATHYGESERRKHGMYRYRNSFPLEVPDCRFYDMTLRCPSETYLEEYFGPDWRVPRKYGYDEGLAGEYKNIIAE